MLQVQVLVLQETPAAAAALEATLAAAASEAILGVAAGAGVVRDDSTIMSSSGGTHWCRQK